MEYEHTHKRCPACSKSTPHYRRATNHILHLLLTVLSLGWWALIWLMLSFKIGGWTCETCGRRSKLPMIITAVVVVMALLCGWRVCSSFMADMAAAKRNRPTRDTAADEPASTPPAELVEQSAAEPEPETVAIEPSRIVDAIDPAALQHEIREVAKQIRSLLDNSRQIAVDSARLYWDGEFVKKPIIEVQVRNDTRDAIKRVFFHGVLSTPSRQLPWVEEDFNYQPPGGLEPGESACWQLAPNMFGKWSDAPRDRDDMVLRVVVKRYETASGQEVAPADHSDEILELKQRLVELRSKLPPEPDSPEPDSLNVDRQPEIAAEKTIEWPPPVPAVPAPFPATFRTWTDSTGGFSVEAEFASMTGGVVKLKKRDGSEIKLPLERLSETDQQWIRDRARR